MKTSVLGLVIFVSGMASAAILNRFPELARQPCGKGVWGELTCVPITIAPSDDVAAQLLPEYSIRNDWHFPHTQRADLEKLFQKAKVPLSALDSAKYVESIKGFVLRPTLEQLEWLTPHSRGVIYDELAESPLNTMQYNAFRFPGTTEEWLKQSKIPHAIAEKIRRESYSDSQFTFFADLPLLLPLLPTTEERIRLLKILSRQHSMLVKLRIYPDSDVQKLAAYWSKGKRTKDVLPLMESLASTGTRQTIDVSHLLPPTVRRLIYSYPNVGHDCFWTALNFFRETTDNSILDDVKIIQELKKNYTIVGGTPELGDVLIFGNPEQPAFHAAVYIAGAIVFTKNGSRLTSPWVFMTLGEMENYYAEHEDVRITLFRNNQFVRDKVASIKE